MKVTKSYVFSRQPRFLPEIPGGEVEIPNPPMAYEKPEISWFIILLPPAVMLIITVIIALSAQSIYMLLSVAMTIMTMIGSVVGATSQIKKYKKKKNEREKKYLQLMADLKAELSIAREKQVKAINEINPDPKTCLERIGRIDSKLWERNPSYNDFLSLRVGIGSMPSTVKVKYTKQQLVLDNDPLAEEPQKLALEFQQVNNVPVCINLFSAEICGIAGEEQKTLELLRVAILQLVTHHGYDDVKLILLLKEDSLAKWDWVRYLPHVWDNEFRTRFLLCGRAIAHQTLGELYDTLKGRELRANKTGQVENNLPHYVFVVEDKSLLENEVINKYLYNGSKNIGVSTIFVEQNRAYLPMNCKVVINLQGSTGEYADKESGQKTIFILDSVEYKELERAARKLAPLRIKQSNASFTLPTSITLMEMLKAKKVEEIDVLSKWQRNRTYKGMSVPIGARAGGELFNLDIHETGFGPHGLVAGTTGSGKSELLQSIIISLAINFHPHDVAFVLIDYKGGGMADVFRGMPHLVGTITNLGGNQTVRALVSIKSELQRRQRIFSEFGVNNIDKYQKLYHNGGAKEPIPHLIMIADEFAELKAEQPEFMKELVSTARVGRSLGVHLILATQKPAGVVDDQIWSNSKFKICLKVQDETDSKDVIKRPDAAMIKEPGRAYIQVGNDEIFEMFQSTWSGADYDPNGELGRKENDVKRIYKVLLNGKTEQVYPIDEEKIAKDELPSQLKAMVDHITLQATNNNIKTLKGPWLPPLPEVVYMDNLYQYGLGFNYETGEWSGNQALAKPYIGLVDNPREQIQTPLPLDFAAEGHLFVYGAPGTGKTVLVSALCLSLAHLYSPSEVNIYIMDFGGTALKQFADLPHCGGVMTIEQETKINQFVLFIFRVIEERKKLFEKCRAENFNAYRVKSTQIMPAIFIMIDNYFALSETYELIDEQMMTLAREGAKFGIFLVATATNATLVRYKFAVNFKMAISLQLTEKAEYDNIVGRTEGLEPSPVPGRGLVRGKPPLEFQTALPQFKDKDTEEIISTFKSFADKNKFAKAVSIPEMPDKVYIHNLNESVKDDTLAIGLNDQDLQPVFVNFRINPTIMIAGDIQTGKSTILVSWITMLADILGDKVRIYAQDSSTMGIYSVLNRVNVTDLSQVEDMYSFIENLKAEIDRRREQINDYRRNNKNLDELYESWQLLVFVFDNLSDFTDTGDYSLKEVLERIVKKEHGLKIAVVAAGNTSDLANNYDGFGKAVREAQCGILLGSLKDQNLFGARLPYGNPEKEFGLGDGYFIVKNRFVGLRAAVLSEGKASY